MVGVGSIFQAAIGSGTNVYGLACTATAPTSLSVNFGQGGISVPNVVDTTAYGSLGTNTFFTMKYAQQPLILINTECLCMESLTQSMRTQ